MKNIYLLDADETLLDFKRSEREQLSRTFARYGIAADGGMIQRFHDINDGLWKKLERGEISRAELVVERFRILFSERGISADAGAFSQTYFSYMKQSAHLLEGAEEFLMQLKKKGRIYIVTNGSAEVQRSRFSLSGLNAYADGVFISQEVGCDKPAPAFAEYVEAHIPDYNRACAVWVGDSLTSDCLCAKSKNIDFILFGTVRPDGYDGLFACDYHEVLRFIETL